MKASKKQEGIINRTKERIVEAARSLFSEYTYLGVSMSDIAKKLNITKAALYYHFTGKEEIYKKVIDGTFKELKLCIIEASNEKTSDKKLYKLIKGYLDFGLKEKNFIKSIMLKLSPGSSDIIKNIIKLREEMIDLFRSLIKEVLSDKKQSRKFDSNLIASLLTGMMDGFLLEYSLLDKKIDSAKVTNQIIAVLL